MRRTEISPHKLMRSHVNIKAQSWWEKLLDVCMEQLFKLPCPTLPWANNARPASYRAEVPRNPGTSRSSLSSWEILDEIGVIIRIRIRSLDLESGLGLVLLSNNSRPMSRSILCHFVGLSYHTPISFSLLTVTLLVESSQWCTAIPPRTQNVSVSGKKVIKISQSRTDTVAPFCFKFNCQSGWLLWTVMGGNRKPSFMMVIYLVPG